MATTISAVPGLRPLLLAAAVIAVHAGGASAQAEEARPPVARVAYYDADAVLRTSGALAFGREHLARLTDRYDAEGEPLQRAVSVLREAVMNGRELPDAERRELEARLAQSTIALLVARSEGARELARARSDARAQMEHEIVPAVARVARQNGLAVVIRTDDATAVLDQDALDVTALVIDALDETRTAPERPSPSEKRRTRLQSCDAPADDAQGVTTR